MQVTLCIPVDLLDDSAVIEKLQRLDDRAAFANVAGHHDAGLRSSGLGGRDELTQRNSWRHRLGSRYQQEEPGTGQR